jgi:hypothetical protein
MRRCFVIDGQYRLGKSGNTPAQVAHCLVVIQRWIRGLSVNGAKCTFLGGLLKADPRRSVWNFLHGLWLDWEDQSRLFPARALLPGSAASGRSRCEIRQSRWRAKALGSCRVPRQYFGDKQPAERKNLEFLIGLRNKVEHRLLPELDAALYGECEIFDV